MRGLFFILRSKKQNPRNDGDDNSDQKPDEIMTVGMLGCHMTGYAVVYGPEVAQVPRNLGYIDPLNKTLTV